MYRQLRIAVVIPAFNEEEAIAAAVESVPDYVDLVIVVDDASTDATLDRALAAKRDSVAIRHRGNLGVGAAIVSGYREALGQDVDVVVVMAGDGQMDPVDLPRLLEPIAEGDADYCKGNRFLHPELFQQMPPIRILGNCVLSMATKLTSGYTHVFDSQCGYTAVTTEILRRIDLDAVFPRYGYPNDVLAHLHRARAKVVDVSVRPVYGPSWKSGVKWYTAIYPVGFVLGRSWWRRVRSERDSCASEL